MAAQSEDMFSRETDTIEQSKKEVRTYIKGIEKDKEKFYGTFKSTLLLSIGIKEFFHVNTESRCYYRGGQNIHLKKTSFTITRLFYRDRRETLINTNN